MLAYFHDYQIENYDWFFRIDDDTVVQWNNLNEFLRGLHLQQNCISSIRMFSTLTLSDWLFKSNFITLSMIEVEIFDDKEINPIN